MKKIFYILGIIVLIFILVVTLQSKTSNNSEDENQSAKIEEINSILNSAGLDDRELKLESVTEDETVKIKDSLNLLTIKEVSELKKHLQKQEKLSTLEVSILQDAKEKTLLADSISEVTNVVLTPAGLIMILLGVTMMVILNMNKTGAEYY